MENRSRAFLADDTVRHYEETCGKIRQFMASIGIERYTTCFVMANPDGILEDTKTVMIGQVVAPGVEEKDRLIAASINSLRNEHSGGQSREIHFTTPTIPIAPCGCESAICPGK